MNQFENIMKNPQEAIQKNLDAQKVLTEDYNAQHLALGQNLAQDIQAVVKNSPFDVQKVASIYSEYQKNVLAVNKKAVETSFEFWTDLAKSFTPKV